jgi:mannose-6-phosphate isomerase-like protein (cupin superfamily)
MRHERSGGEPKGWLAGPWDGGLAVSVGFANAGIDEPHVHERISELYLVARGRSLVRVEQQSVELRAGDLLVVEPGEAHTFLESSDDYFHFVVHAPGLAGEEARQEKAAVPRERLGLAPG